MDRVAVGKIGNKHTIIRTAAVAVFMGLCLFIGTADAAMPVEADLFEKAYGFYQSGEHGKAAELFGTFLKEYPESSVRDSVLFWQAKSFIRLGSPDKAKALLDTLIEQYPQSSFSGFARQELEVMRQTAASVPAVPVAGGVTQTTQQREPDPCSENLRKADDRFRVLKEQLADSSARNQSLENELTAAIRDREYLKSVIDELKQAGDGTPKSTVDVGMLKAENARLQQELRTLSSRQQSRDIIDGPGKQMVDKDLLDDALRKNKALEQKNREILEKALVYITQTDERLQKLESEREIDKGRLREAEKRQTVLDNKQAGAVSVRSQAETQAGITGDERNMLEKKLRDQETALAGLRSERDELRKRVLESQSENEGLKTRAARLAEAAKSQAEAVREGAHAKDLDAYSRLREESSQLAQEAKKAEPRIRQLEDENIALRKKMKEAEQRAADAGNRLARLEKERAEAEQKRAESEVQAKKAAAERALLERQLKEKDAAIAKLEKIQGEKEKLRTEKGRNLAPAKQNHVLKGPKKKNQNSKSQKAKSQKANNHNRRKR